MMMTYKDKQFKSVSSSDLGIETEGKENSSDSEEKDNKELFEYMKSILKEKVKDVRASVRLKNHPVCLSNDGELSIEMEKVLNSMPNSPDIKADKVLEINTNHEVFKSLRAYEKDEIAGLYTTLYNQALLMKFYPSVIR